MKTKEEKIDIARQAIVNVFQSLIDAELIGKTKAGFLMELFGMALGEKRSHLCINRDFCEYSDGNNCYNTSEIVSDEAAEKIVISSIIIDNDLFGSIESTLTEADFYNYRNRAIYYAMKEIRKEGFPIDVVTIRARLRNFTKRIGDDYLFETANFVKPEDCSESNIKANAQILLEKTTIRKLTLACRQISEKYRA